MGFESIGHSIAENAMLTELLSASDALQLSRYKEFLSHSGESDRNCALDQAMEEAIHRTSGNRIRGLSVRHVEGQIFIVGQANSYHSRQLVVDLVRSATEGTGQQEFSARIDIKVNGDRPDVVFAGCPASTIVVSTVPLTNETQPKMIGR